MIELLRDFVVFLRTRRNLWLVPLVVLLLALGTIVVAVEGSAVAPFIYSLF